MRVYIFIILIGPSLPRTSAILVLFWGNFMRSVDVLYTRNDKRFIGPLEDQRVQCDQFNTSFSSVIEIYLGCDLILLSYELKISAGISLSRKWFLKSRDHLRPFSHAQIRTRNLTALISVYPKQNPFFAASACIHSLQVYNLWCSKNRHRPSSTSCKNKPCAFFGFPPSLSRVRSPR